MTIEGYVCRRCGNLYPRELEIDTRGCPACWQDAPANLRPLYQIASNSSGKTATGKPSLWRYAPALPVPIECAVTLGEGLTPLVAAERIGSDIGVPLLFIKDESRNPTWSHKDRFSTVAVSFARDSGADVVATASSGNAGASLAAYAAHAGMRCIVATFASTSGAMVSQIRAYGATVVSFGEKQDRWSFLERGAERNGWFVTSPYRSPVVGSHPVGIDGYKTLAYEICDQFDGQVPEWCALPVCYGDALAGIWDGFKELAAAGKIDRLPRLIAAEIHGSLALAMATDSDRVPDRPADFASLAVSIGTRQSTFQALQALRQSGGLAVSASNDELISMQACLAARQGIFAELASVAPLVAIRKLVDDKIISHDDRVVAIATASGLKDVGESARFMEPLPTFHDVEEALAQIG